MALIICPECKNQVSDKAEFCPHCGLKIAGNPDIIGDTQNSSVNIKQQSLQTRKDFEQTSSTQQYESDNLGKDRITQKGGNGKSKSLIIVSFLVALVIVGTAYYFYNNSQSEKEQEDYEYAMQTDDPMVLKMYLSRYADASQAHRDSVNVRLEMLSQKDTDWMNAVTSGTKNALEDYINNNPNSPHKGEALNKIDSIDFAIASRINSIDSYTKYLQQHPDGKYAGQAQDFLDSRKETEVSNEDIVAAKTIFKHFFQAINSHNESKLLETVSEQLTNFLNKRNATGDDVITFMNKLYKDDVKNLNWHITDDFKFEKVKNEDDSYNLKVEFPAELKMDRTDPNKEKYGKYIISGEISSYGKISKLTMKKVEVQN